MVRTSNLTDIKKNYIFLTKNMCVNIPDCIKSYVETAILRQGLSYSKDFTANSYMFWCPHVKKKKKFIT